MHKVTESLIHCASAASEALSAKAIVFDAEVFAAHDELLEVLRALPSTIVVANRTKEKICDECDFPTVRLMTVPDVRLSRTGQVKLSVLVGVAEQLFERGDLLICLSGVEGSNRLDMMTFLKVGDDSEFFLTDEQHPLPPDVDAAVFERILSIVSELAVEGRESRPVGGLFVLGDSEKVLESSRQLVFNPFHGYPEDERNILSGNLDETIKEFSAIDGAFIIRGDGVVLAAGRYLMAQSKTADGVRSGLGTRHESAAAITKSTDAVAIVLSQSTSTITIFNSGKIMTEIERIKEGGPAQGLRFKRLVDNGD